MDPEPLWDLVAPETGMFTMEGGGKILEDGRKSADVLVFHVRRPDGKVDTWGWAIGTSTLRD